jgi:acetyltransferase
LPEWAIAMNLEQERAAAGGRLNPALDIGTELTTRSGMTFLVRSADETDEAMLAEFFTHVTPEDLRFRFLSAIQHAGHAQLALLTQVDHRRVENFLAFDVVTGCLLASAMLAIEDDLERSEVAVVIRSDFKNRGIGWSLLDHAAAQAAAMGVKTLQAIELPENRTAIRVELDMGFTSRPYPGDATLTLLERSLAGVRTAAIDRSAA